MLISCSYPFSFFVSVLVICFPVCLYGALPAGFVTVNKGTVQLSGTDRKVTIVSNETVRAELNDTIRTGKDLDSVFYGFDGSSFVLASESTYDVDLKGLFRQSDGSRIMCHGFLVPLTQGNLNGTIPRGRQPGAQWFSNIPLKVDVTSAGAAVPTTSGKISNGDVLHTVPLSIAKVNGGSRGTVLMAPSTSLRLLPSGYSLESGGGMFHLGPDSRMELFTPLFYLSAVDCFLEISLNGNAPVVKVLKGKTDIHVSSGADESSRKVVVRGGQTFHSGENSIESSGSRSELYKVAKDFISRMNENGLYGFSQEYIASLCGGNSNLSQIEPVEGPSLPLSIGSVPRETLAAPPVQISANRRPPHVSHSESGDSMAVVVPVEIEKTAESALNPLDRSLAGERSSDWYKE